MFYILYSATVLAWQDTWWWLFAAETYREIEEWIFLIVSEGLHLWLNKLCIKTRQMQEDA
jgi:hypothetical protein